MLNSKHILLVITGGIAAYKGLELIRLIQKAGGTVQVILTKAATQFVTPLSVAALTGRPALTELFEVTQEAEIGHIALSRSADLIVVAPASADFLAKLANGLCDDLASTCLLATDTEILVAPAMNVRMWQAAATQRNLATLAGDKVHIVAPGVGPMACGEFGPGRLAEPEEILAAIVARLAPAPGPLAGRHALVTAGPTREPVDPVRYFSNASSGKQGYAIAAALAQAGARVTLVSGPVELAAPKGCDLVKVETALEMQAAVHAALPADIAIFAAAVADWRIAEPAKDKLKKTTGAPVPVLSLVQNPDILAEVSRLPAPQRPTLVIGFAAETSDLLGNAQRKFLAKGCDWLLANDVSATTGVFGGDANHVVLLTAQGQTDWGAMPKTGVADRLVTEINTWFNKR